MKHLNLEMHAERYAGLRKALGFKFRFEYSLLHQFVRFLESQDSPEPIRAAMALTNQGAIVQPALRWLFNGPSPLRHAADVAGKSPA